MAPEMSYEPRTMNDKSALPEGWCPAFLMAITDEETPENWVMFQQSPRMWRWKFLVWPQPTLIDRQAPERQSAPTSQKFSPGGKYQASKAYIWTCELLSHKIQPGERVNLDPLLPLPCRVKIRRNNDYANIVDLERWDEGQALLTDQLKAMLLSFFANPPEPSPQPTPQPPIPAAQPVPQPGMQSWQRPAPAPAQPPAQQPATPDKLGW